MDSTQTTARAVLGAVSPFFIVSNLQRALGFYRDELGFEVTFTGPDIDPFFATVRRDAVQILLKVVADDVEAVPNRHRHPDARWDAFIYVADPDTLAAEFDNRGVAFSARCRIPTTACAGSSWRIGTAVCSSSAARADQPRLRTTAHSKALSQEPICIGRARLP